MAPDPFYQCGTCRKPFPSGWQARDKHCTATGHSRPAHECSSCSRVFASHPACFAHMEALNHFFHQCEHCDETRPNVESLTFHEQDYHLYCGPCGRFFNNPNNLKMHMNSRTHRPTIPCPFCKRDFASATGLTHHLERQACPNAQGLSRDRIYNIVRAKDTTGVISKNLIGWTGKDVVYSANERSWNGRAFECYICHRQYAQLQGLNQHLASPAHQQTLYHCPNGRCRVDFKSLAALFNHLESEACNFMRFDVVQQQARNVMDPTRRLAF